MLPLYLHFLGVPVVDSGVAPVILVYLLGLAFLMVSTIPVYSGKTMGKYVPRHLVLPIFVVSVAVFGLLVSFPFEMLTAITILFLATIPVGVMRYRAMARDHATVVAPPVSDEPAAPGLPPET
jgi:CDP-diacylglycerol--serine O-phosphatidyltransferase